MNERILLSPPNVGETEREAVVRAVDSGWIAPLGPEVDLLESDFCDYLGVESGSVAALSSGTAALELAYRIKGVVVGDPILIPTFTFVATANAAAYVGAEPIFIDADEATWNISIERTIETIDKMLAGGRPPKAVVAVEMYGTCSDWQGLRDHCRAYDIALIEDSAEALGSSFDGQLAGTLADVGVFSFNGNKIITCGGGGVLVGSPEVAERARWLSTQAREPVGYYEHKELGFNYRLSNISAAIARAQLARLDEFVSRRRQIRARYVAGLEHLGIGFNPVPERSLPNSWLTVMIAPDGIEPDRIIDSLGSQGIESRRAWKPMHTQPLYAEAMKVGGKVAESVFDRGVCLPSGSAMTDEQVDRVVSSVASVVEGY